MDAEIIMEGVSVKVDGLKGTAKISRLIEGVAEIGQSEVVVSDALRTTSVILLQGLVGENDFAEAVSRIEPDGLPLL